MHCGEFSHFDDDHFNIIFHYVTTARYLWHLSAFTSDPKSVFEMSSCQSYVVYERSTAALKISSRECRQNGGQVH